MTSTTVVVSTGVVNTETLVGGDFGSHTRQARPVSTLLERIRWVLDHRLEVVKSANNWGIMANLARQWGDTTIQRLEEDPEYEKGIKVGTLEALARAAQVSVPWFVLGRGDPEEQSPLVDERYSNLARAAEAARALGTISESAIENVWERRLQAGSDPSPDEWLEDIRAENRRLRRAEQAGADPAPGRPVADDDD